MHSFNLHHFQTYFPISFQRNRFSQNFLILYQDLIFSELWIFKWDFKVFSKLKSWFPKISTFSISFSNPKIDFLKDLIFLRIHFPFQKSFSQWTSWFSQNSKIHFRNRFPQKSNPNLKIDFLKVQVFLRIHFPFKSHFLNANFWFPMKFNDFPRNSIFKHFSNHFPSTSQFSKANIIFLKLASFQNFIAHSMILCAF